MVDWDCMKDEEEYLVKEEGFDRDQAAEIAGNT